MKTYSTSDLAKQAGIGIHTVRYYLRRGLISPTSHRPSGQGVFTEQDIQRLKLIIDAKGQGLTLGEIEKMLQLLQDPDMTCQEMVEFFRSKLEEIDRKIKELTEIRNRIARELGKCGSAAKGERCETMVRQLEIVNNGKTMS